MTEQTMTVGDRSIAIQNTGNNVTVSVGTAALTLARRHRLKAKPTTERELLLTELRATDLVGRSADLAALDAWLADARPIALRCLIGSGGAGKTRLGIELCERAEAAGWTAGFATQTEVQRFHDAKSAQAWHWGKNTLIVVDYAAAATRVLRPWLEELAGRIPVPGEGRLRLLLLERHADRTLGWWPELTSPGGLSGHGPENLLAPAEPIPLTPLDAVTERHTLLRQTVNLAAEILGKPAPVVPAPGQNLDFDRRLGASARETEPLYLLMAGLVGVQTGVLQALALSHTVLAERVAISEASRLARWAIAKGIDTDPTAPVMMRLAACITLQGGTDRAATSALIREERTAMEFPSAPPTEAVVAHLAEALMRDAGGVDAVRPDIVGEAFVLRQLATDGSRWLNRPPWSPTSRQDARKACHVAPCDGLYAAC